MSAFPVLITQCLQADFVGPLGRHDPLPNALHVGAEEASRLLGADPAHGPLAQLMAWARAQPHDALEVLHIRDCHDPGDAAQRDHLQAFGKHCVRGTPGAELVLGLDAAVVPLPNEAFVEATGLNDFQGTRLAAELERIRAVARGQPLRVGVIGVWTEAKVSFLLYELKTRYPELELATCSALTASASRLQHFNALEQLSRILGVKVFDAVGEFAGWLADAAGAPVRLAPLSAGPSPRMELAGEAAPLGDEERRVLGHLYRECRQLELHPLGGGFSGARVFRVASVDQLGHAQAPSVAKLGPTRLIGKERTAFEKVQGVLGNSAPSVQGFVDAGAAAGIRYSYASMRQGRIRTLKSLFEKGAPTADIVRVVRHVFDDVFAPFFAASRYERLPLFEHYGFARTELSLDGPRLVPQLQFAGHVRANVKAIAGGDAAAGEVLRHADGSASWNPCRFYEFFLPVARIPWSDSHYVCTVHGDLNGANVLMDDVGNVWVIDFFHTGPGHVWKDLVKLESDLLYLFTPLRDEAELREALRISHALREVEDLRAPLPESLPGLEAPALQRAWTVLRELRLLGAERTREDRNPWQLDVALLRYAVHTLSFDEASPLQKRWALASAGGWAQDTEEGTPRAPVLRPGWVDMSGLNVPAGAGLAVVPCPGRKDWGHMLEQDLRTLKSGGAQALVGIISGPELRWAGAHDLPERCAEVGLAYALHHVPDQGVPELEDARRWVAEATARVRRGEKVVFHCLGGLGRSGMLAACTLAALGLTPAEAIRRVRAERGPRALETEAQQRFVEWFQ
ncbi:MAG: isochorismatase family protein [Deltaproteobacteria bacterium]|nr:isochorismatase family protein [Deltaproteobacteria bacterium]